MIATKGTGKPRAVDPNETIRRLEAATQAALDAVAALKKTELDILKREVGRVGAEAIASEMWFRGPKIERFTL